MKISAEGFIYSNMCLMLDTIVVCVRVSRQAREDRTVIQWCHYAWGWIDILVTLHAEVEV